MGRPTDYCAETANAICARLMDGESLRTICSGDNMPARSSVHLCLAAHKDFSDQYAMARERQADTIFDECLAIADTPLRGERKTTKADGAVETVEEDMIAHRRLQIDARKWMAGKLRPKVYGDKTILGGDPDNPIRTELADTDLARLIVFHLTKAARPT